MERYRKALKAMKGRFEHDPYKGEHWDYFNPKWIFVRQNVVWSRDCRTFLRSIQSAGLTDDGKRLQKSILLADVENKLREYRMISKNKDGLLLMAISFIPLLRDIILLRQGILYSNSSSHHFQLVKEWCDDMRDLEEQLNPYTKDSKLKLEGKSSTPSREKMSPKTPGLDEIMNERRDFSRIPQEVFIQSLVGNVKLRTIKDIIKLSLAAIISFFLFLILLSRDSDRYLITKCIVRLKLLSLLGYPQRKEDLAEFLCNQIWHLSDDVKPLSLGRDIKIPGSILRRDHSIFVNVHSLQDSFSSQVIVAPIPEKGSESFYLNISTMLHGCNMVTLQYYAADCPATSFEPVLFFPRMVSMIPVLGVQKQFLNIFHGDAPFPSVMGCYSHSSFLAFEVLWSHVRFPYGDVFGSEIAKIVASRSAQFKQIGVTHHPHVVQPLTKELIRIGYAYTGSREYKVFDGMEAAETLIAVYPSLLRLLSFEEKVLL